MVINTLSYSREVAIFIESKRLQNQCYYGHERFDDAELQCSLL